MIYKEDIIVLLLIWLDMATDLMDDTYYTSSDGEIPVKWTEPELTSSRASKCVP